jgi:hypothetical protein
MKLSCVPSALKSHPKGANISSHFAPNVLFWETRFRFRGR